jgi:glycosyltransferase involved in cell wall biosynthesis
MAAVVDPVPAHVVPNGVDVSLFRPIDRLQARRRLGWEQDARHVLFAGNPADPAKGWKLAAAALDIAGARLPFSVRMTGLSGIAADEVPLHMNASDVMLVTSHSEGSPNTVKEAMACDLPVVSVPVGDVPDLLAGVSSSGVYARDPAALADALLPYLLAPVRSDGRAALIRRGLDLPSVAGRVVAIYDGVLARRRAGRGHGGQ